MCTLSQILYAKTRVLASQSLKGSDVVRPPQPRLVIKVYICKIN